MKNAYYSTRFGFLKDLAFGAKKLFSPDTNMKPLCWSLPGSVPLDKAGPVGSANPQAAASTWSKWWVG